MASAAATATPGREAVRDPVLLLPLAVGAGLAIGWLGVHDRVPGSRIVVDLALAWSLVTASLVALERPRWQRAAWLLAAAAFALLGADLAWTSTRAIGTIGVLLGWLWAALLVQLVLTFPAGRPWTRLTWGIVAVAYAAAIGGQIGEVASSADAQTAHRAQE